MHGSDEGIKLRIYDGKVIDTILGNVDGITLRLDVGPELGSLYGYFDGSIDGNFEGFLHGDSLMYNDGKVHGSDEGINWDILMVKCLVLYFDIYIESHLGLMLEHSSVP